MKKKKLPQRDKIYFASDFHLGVPNFEKSKERELQLIRWMDEIKEDASEVFLVGDLFDFWFEYKYLVPKGFIRFLGKIIELQNLGIKFHFFTGNHDMWMFDYFEKELGIPVYRKPIEINRAGKSFYIGHGDGLGPGDYSYKFLKIFFASKFCQFLFARLHPNFSFWIANLWSKNSRIANNKKEQMLSKEEEWLYVYSKEILEKKHFDYFIFGHRHLPLDLALNEKSRYLNLGEWLHYNTYVVFDGSDCKLKSFEK